ncbi:Phytanoyl-CoA dioxygenase [Ceraceosorus bombacis]|uniref:Phytanoyl-CoA dioxygenase n=1 Tax=Ceraceosorus bombacis TaxID=401625 RepID=A0A0P1BPI9_9BASI|nr:Phytanoyl-CoA dioxygenase [Ceraceosorus bombacis]
MTSQHADAADALSRYDLEAIRAAYRRDGYVILDGIFDFENRLSLEELRVACHAAVERTRRGEWPHRRVVGKSFPPYDPISDDSWGVQHLLHPDLIERGEGKNGADKYDSIFARLYGSSPLLDIAAALLDTQPDKMQLELFNLLINPACHAFALPWHRDDVRADVSSEEEEARLSAPTYGVQWNAALYDDECLFICPGSHARLRTEAEKRANAAKAPPATKVLESQGVLDARWQVDPPNTLQVKLKAGQTAFYSQRVLHRASYLPSQIRATLHGCYGGIRADASLDSTDRVSEQLAFAERARNVLQHNVEWMKEPSFGASLPPRLQPMWRNLLVMDAHAKGRQLGYSLENA